VPHKSDHLQLHGRQYRARVAIPADVRKAFGGKAFLIAPLGTPDLSEADRRKGEHVSRFKRQIAQARDTGDPVLHEARMFRRWEEERFAANPNDPEDDNAADAQLLDLAEIVAEEHGNEASQAFYEICAPIATLHNFQGHEGNTTVNHQTLSSFIWSVADLLRGDYKQADYGKVILPFTVLMVSHQRCLTVPIK
jgi:hypothetical protein